MNKAILPKTPNSPSLLEQPLWTSQDLENSETGLNNRQVHKWSQLPSPTAQYTSEPGRTPQNLTSTDLNESNP
jgi:hypothetical protein